MDDFRVSRRAERRALGRLCFLLALGTVFSGLILATTIIPISDRELLSRADVVVRGVVVSNEVSEDSQGRPQTVSIISPLEVLKGEVAGPLVLRELGGELPDGRFFKIWGRPEYQPGHEVVVFALARPGGDYQTAELLLGKFEVQKDEADQLFAVPSLAADGPAGVTVARPQTQDGPAEKDSPLVDSAAPRELEAFLRMIRRPAVQAPATPAEPQGKLQSVVHREYVNRAIGPAWVNQGGLWRWNNGATAVFTLDGIAHVTGGGVAEANGAAAEWSTEPHSTIGYSIGSNTANLIHMDALTSPCGWTSCLAGGGVIGCGGFQGGGTNVWRGETYVTITSGEVWLRSYCTLNLYDSTFTQSVLTHELGHTLGLGHSDSGFSPHDVCIGDEGLAIMRSMVQYRKTLGTDDQDAVRWLYGDGGNSCKPSSAPSVTGISPASGPTTGSTSVTINGSNFQAGATVTIGGVPATGVGVTSSTSITATTGAHAPATVDVIVTNPDGQSGTFSAGFTYVCVSVPRATVSGGGIICSGSSAQVVATLTGIPPWNLTWSDGFVQSGIAASPATRIVTPASTTTYTVTSVTSAFCAGSSSGSASISVQSCVGGSSSGNLLPDGRSVSGTLGATGSVYRTSSVASRSYAVEIDLPFASDGGRSPMLSITRADGSSFLSTRPLDRAACDANAAGRLTFTPAAADLSAGPLQIHVTDSVSSGYAFRLRAAETTMYAPGWTTNGYSAFVVVQNTSDGAVSGQVVLLSFSGSTVLTLPFTLSVGGSIQVAIPSGLSVISGSARLTHDGPPGAITAGVYMTAPGPSGVAFQWPFSSVRSYGASDGK